MSPVPALHAHLARLDARADALLLRDAAPDDAEIRDLDVLLASIGELRELLAERGATV
jgi:hypothetical protein